MQTRTAVLANPDQILQQAVQLFQSGQPKQALAKCKKLIKSHPKAPPPHNLGGIAAYQLGDLPLANKLLTKACRLAPEWDDAWSNLGIVLQAQGKLEAARDALAKALSLAPDNAAAISNMASVKEALGEIEEAEDMARRAVALVPNAADSLNTLGQILSTAGKLDEAEETYWRTLEVNPGFTSALFNLANFLENNNRLERIPKLMAAAERIGLDDVNLAIPFAKYLRRENRTEEAIQTLERHRKAKMAPRLAKLYFGELGSCYDKVGNHARAFEAFTQSNKMAKTAASRAVNKTVALNRIKMMDDLIGNPAYLAQSPETVSSHPTPAFLVGFPRSGTTLLEQVLDSHPDIQAIPEQNMVVNLIERIGEYNEGYPAALKTLKPDQHEELVKLYWEEANRHIDPGKPGLVVDKMPLNMGYVPMLWRLFPEAKFIFVLRHPVDVCLSCFMQTFLDNHAMANFYRFNDAAAFYDVAAKAWLDACDHLAFQHITIRYEDVVEDLGAEARRMIEFLGLEWRDEVLDYRERVVSKKTVTTPSYSQVSEAIYTRAKGRWLNYRDLLDSNDLSVLAPYLERFGYPALDES